jgi:membrane protein implicated in regulation of membrane protease activity
MIAFILGVVSSVLRAYVAALYWSWFMVPKFNVPEVNLLFVMMIGTTYGLMFTPVDTYIKLVSHAEKGKTQSEKTTEQIGGSVGIIIVSIVALGIGWVVNHYGWAL